jgi:hypothetical protein
MNVFDLLEAITLLKRLHDQYSANPNQIACDLIAMIARVAAARGVTYAAMEMALRKGFGPVHFRG